MSDTTSFKCPVGNCGLSMSKKEYPAHVLVRHPKGVKAIARHLRLEMAQPRLAQRVMKALQSSQKKLATTPVCT